MTSGRDGGVGRDSVNRDTSRREVSFDILTRHMTYGITIP